MLSAPAAIPATRHGDLQVRVDPALAARPDMLRDQLRQPGALRQGHHRYQAAMRHEIRVIERCLVRESYATIALARCPLDMGDGSFENSHHPSSEGTFRVPAPEIITNSPVD